MTPASACDTEKHSNHSLEKSPCGHEHLLAAITPVSRRAAIPSHSKVCNRQLTRSMRNALETWYPA